MKNNIDDVGCCYIANFISKLNKLSKIYLNLANNAISSQGAEKIWRSLSELKELKKCEVGMSSNKIEDPTEGLVFSLKERGYDVYY